MSDWERQHAPRFDVIERLVASCGESLGVLDVGASPYHLTRRLDALDNVSRVYAVDRNVSGFTPDGVVMREFNVEENWPLESNSFDVVVMGAIVEHLLNPWAALLEARRVGKVLVLSTPNGLSLKRRAETALGLDTPHDGLVLPGTGEVYDRHQHEFSRGELIDLLDKSGWYPEDVRSVQLKRTGLTGSVYELAASLWGGWGDQIVIRAGRARRSLGEPSVYREGVVSRHE